MLSLIDTLLKALNLLVENNEGYININNQTWRLNLVFVQVPCFVFLILRTRTFLT